MYFKKLLILVIFIMISPLNALTAFQTEKDTLSPKIVFKALIYDAGIVKPGDEVQGSYIIENKGNADLQIINVSPS